MAEQTQQNDPQDKAKSDADKAQPDKGKGGQQTAEEKKGRTLTDDELKAEREAAVKEYQRQQADADRKKAEAEARAKEEEKGEFDKVKARLEAERDAERLKVKQADARLALRDYLGADDKRRPYLPSAAWIEKAVDVTADTDPKDVEKLVKEAADKFIADNPREAPKPAPGGGARGRDEVRGRAAEVAAAKANDNKTNGQRPFSTLRARV